MNFGKYAVLQPVEYKFKEEPDWWWKINPPTSGDELEIARLLNRGKITMGYEGTSRDAPPNLIEIAHREIALTFGGTNIPKGEGNKPILEVGAIVSDIENVLRLMPHPMVLEIWEAIADAIPGWGGRRDGIEEDKEPEEDQDPNSEGPES